MGTADLPSIAPGPSRHALRNVSIAGVVLATVLIGVLTQSGLLGRGPVIGFVITDPSKVPAAGEVWIGTDFDPRTFQITDRTTIVGPGAALAAVAHLTTSIGDGEAFWQLLYNDQPFQTNLLRLSGTGDFLGTTISAIHQEGRYEYDIVDLEGNVLAAGRFVVASQ